MENIIYCFTEILIAYPIIDGFAGILWYSFTARAWENIPANLPRDCVQERQLGASVIHAQLNSIVTGCSIILAGNGAFIALALNNIKVTAKFHILFAIIEAAISLSLALYAFSILPSRSVAENFVRSKQIALFCSMALFFLLAAAFRFCLGIAMSMWFPHTALALLGGT